MSRDGRYVLYTSGATEIVGTQFIHFETQVVVYDRTTGQNTLVSHSSASATTPADESSVAVAISGDGRFILFFSASTDLVPDQVNTVPAGQESLQLFLYDQATGTTSLVTHTFGRDNVTSNQVGIDLDSISLADDGTVAYTSEATDLVGFTTTQRNDFLYSPGTQTNQLLSVVSGAPTTDAGASLGIAISHDGSAVAYLSPATDLFPGQVGGGPDDVFRYDRRTGTTTLVSGEDGSATNAAAGCSSVGLAISGDGRFISFISFANDLIPGESGASGNVYLYDALGPSLVLVSGVDGSATVGAGQTILQRGGYDDPITPLPLAPNPVSISDDGGLVAYASQAADLVPGQAGAAGAYNIFLYTRATGESVLVTGASGSATAAANGASADPLLSGDGSTLVFPTLATNLQGGLFDANGVADVYLYTPASAAATLVSRAAFPAPPLPGDSFSTSVSADGRYTVFTSTASDLVANEIKNNDNQNVYLFDKQTGAVTLVNHVPGLPNTTGNGGIINHNVLRPAGQPVDSRPLTYVQTVISADGSFIAFASYDDNLVPGTSQAVALDLYLYNVQTGAVTLVPHPQGAEPDDGSCNPVISADGRYVAYLLGFDTTGPFPFLGKGALVLYDRVTGTSTFITPFTTPPNTSPDSGTATGPAISDDGRFVSYTSQDNVYLFDRTTGSSALVSHAFGSSAAANGPSGNAVLSHDGTGVAFVSAATNLVNGQVPSSFTNVFWYANDGSGAVSLVSGALGSATAGGDGNSDSPAIGTDRNHVAYRSDATNLVAGSITGSNAYEFDTQARTQTLISHQAGTATAAAGGVPTPVLYESPAIVMDGDGHLVSYVSTADDLIPGQSGPAGVQNVFVWLR